jgi:hypothetical protein
MCAAVARGPRRRVDNARRCSLRARRFAVVIADNIRRIHATESHEAASVLRTQRQSRAMQLVLGHFWTPRLMSAFKLWKRSLVNSELATSLELGAIGPCGIGGYELAELGDSAPITTGLHAIQGESGGYLEACSCL